MNCPKRSQSLRVSVAGSALLASALLAFAGFCGGCGGPKKVAKLDDSAARAPAAKPFISPEIPPVQTPPDVTGSVDSGIALQFPAMTEQQIKDGLPNVRKMVRQAYPNITDAQRQKMLKQAEDAMRSGGGVVLVP